MFYTVWIIDAITRENALVVGHRLVKYQVQAPTAAAARIKALEHHRAQADRGDKKVRCSFVEPAAFELVDVMQISDAPIDANDAEQLERTHHAYVIA